MRREDSMVDRLRAEARGYQPEVPAGVRRGVMSALAGMEVSRRGRQVPRWWLSVAGVGVAVVVIALVVRSRAVRPVVVRGPQPSGMRVVLPDTPVAMGGDLLTVARGYIDRPLEGEVDRLVVGLARARDTVVRVLPAPVKRERAAGTRPAGVGA